MLFERVLCFGSLIPTANIADLAAMLRIRPIFDITSSTHMGMNLLCALGHVAVEARRAIALRDNA